MEMNITRGKIQTAQKVVIYGPEGIGKSTFASQFPEPLFIDTEGSTKNLDVARMDKPSSWAMLKNQLAYVKANPDICKTLIIDTIDWAEQLCVDDICAANGKKGIEDFGWGNGYVYEKEEFGRFLNSLEEFIDLGINVVLTAHAQMRKFSQPDEVGEYDRWELKLGKKTNSQISPLVKEWADMILFASYKTFAVAADKEGKKFKAQGGDRVMYTQHHPCWDAKNRHDLADELPFDYSQIAHIFATVQKQTAAPVSQTQSPPPVQNVPPAQTTPAARSRQPVQTPPAVQNTQLSPAPAQTVSDMKESYPPTEIVIPENISKALKDLMRDNKVSEEEIRLAVSQRGYMPEDMPIENYPPDFINGCLIGAWEQVFGLVKDNRGVPF